MENMKFNAVATSVANYIDEVGKNELILALAGSATSIKNFANQKLNGAAEQDLHLMEMSGEFHDAKNCDLTDSTVTFTDRKIKGAYVKEELAICANELAGKYFGYNMSFNASGEKVPFEGAILEEFKKSVGNNLEDLIWNGITINTVKYDGIKDIVTTVVKGGAQSNAYELVLAGIKALNPKSAKQTVFYVSPEMLNEIKLCLLARDFRLIDVNPQTDIDGQDEITMPIFGNKIRAVSALTGRDIYALVDQHVVYGWDGDSSDVAVVFDSVTEKTIFRAKLVAGVQVAYLSETFVVKAED